jgi:hypothetical protein
MQCAQRLQPVSGLINHADDSACTYPSPQDGTVIKYPPEVSKRPAIPPFAAAYLPFYAAERDVLSDRKARVMGLFH